MDRYVAWYTTSTEAEAIVFDTEREAQERASSWALVAGYVAGGVFKVPARWTRRGALDNAINRAHRAQRSEA